MVWGLAAAVVTAALVLGWWLLRPAAINPPVIASGNLDPAIVEAIDKAREAVLRRPRSDETWGALGKILIANKLWEDSRVCFLKAERLAKKPLWLYYEGIALYSLGRLEESIDKLREAVRLWESAGEDAPTARLRLGKALMDGHFADEADGQFRRVLAVRGDRPGVRGQESGVKGMAHIGLAQLAYEREDWLSCRHHFEAAYNDPHCRKLAATQLPPVCLRLDDAPAAAKYEKLAAQLPPDLAMNDPFSPISSQRDVTVTKQAQISQAQRLYAMGRAREAVQILSPLLDQYPDDAHVNVIQGKSLCRMDDFDSGRKLLKKATELAADDFEPHFSLAMCLVNEGEKQWSTPDAQAKARELFALAADSARRAIAINPAAGLAHMYLGVSLKYLGQWQAALSSLNEAVHCNPEQWEPHLRLGTAFLEHDQVREARFHLEQANRLSPDNPRIGDELKKLPDVK